MKKVNPWALAAFVLFLAALAWFALHWYAAALAIWGAYVVFLVIREIRRRQI